MDNTDERNAKIAKQLALAYYLADFNNGHVVRGRRFSLPAWCGWALAIIAAMGALRYWGCA